MVGDSSKVTKIGKGLDANLRLKIITLIQEFKDIFAWDPKDMLGIPKS